MMTAFCVMLSMLTSCGDDNAKKEKNVIKDTKIVKVEKKEIKMDGNQAKAILKKYVEDNNILVEPTESGLYYVKTQDGNGEKPAKGDIVMVHYTGKLLDGTVFDSSIERGEPITFPIGVGYVIPGWEEGIMMLSKGEKGVLYIPYDLAYGEGGAGGVIPPFANLIFEVELVDFRAQ